MVMCSHSYQRNCRNKYRCRRKLSTDHKDKEARNDKFLTMRSDGKAERHARSLNITSKKSKYLEWKANSNFLFNGIAQ